LAIFTYCSELEKAKQAAADSFNDLLQLRNSLQSSSSPQLEDLTLTVPTVDILEQSVAEVDSLLNMFRESMSTVHQQSNSENNSLPTPSLGRSRSSQSGSLRSSVFGLGYSLQQSVDDAETIAPILEKYSDKLLEIMTRKINSSLLLSKP